VRLIDHPVIHAMAGGGRDRRGPVHLGAVLVATVLMALVAGACNSGPGVATTMVPASIGPTRTVGPVAAITRGEIERALGERGIALRDVQTPFRPAEGDLLSVAPRAVYQAVLPKDPAAGHIVVYELADPDHAQGAAENQAAFLATGYGRVQTSIDAVDVIRVLGSTVILYTWVPGSSPDPNAAEVAAALETLGIGVAVPS